MKRTVLAAALVGLAFTIGSCASESATGVRSVYGSGGNPIEQAASKVYEGQQLEKAFDEYKSQFNNHEQKSSEEMNGRQTMVDRSSSEARNEAAIDRAIYAYEESLRLQPTGTWTLNKNQPNSIVVGGEKSAPIFATANPPPEGVQALLERARNTKQRWVEVEKPEIERQRLAEQQRKQEGINTYLRASGHLIESRFKEAIIDYEAAINLGVLNPSQTEEAQRLLRTARDLQAAVEAISRPLTDTDFEVGQMNDNTIAITQFKLSGVSRKIQVDKKEYSINIPIPELAIPSRLYGLPVSAITGFSGKGIQSVVIPDTVKLIAEGAFQNNLLTQVKLGSGVMSIGGSAFRGNRNLNEIAIPNSVTQIGDNAFRDCGLTSITWGRGIQNIGTAAFSGNRLTSVILPAGIKQVSYRAFENNRLESISVPGGIELLTSPFNDVGVFVGNAITRATLPANLTEGNMRSYGFEVGLQSFYTSQNRAAGTYVKNGPIWTK
ncbi:MAG: leucine-rich repeat domain-containing protein [Treponema sp.]|nr:leucine-rich repeat domain-containing protein [Treponema sp.]